MQDFVLPFKPLNPIYVSVCLSKLQSKKCVNINKTFRLVMKYYHMILLGVLLLNLGSVLADCTEEQDKNTRNTIQWFIRNNYQLFYKKKSKRHK